MNASCPRNLLFCLVLASALSVCRGGTTRAPSDEELAKIEFQQNLGTQVNLGLAFLDETGRQVELSQYFGKKPVILVLGYYECPMLCTLVMNGMIESLEDLKWSIGKEFKVVNVSIDPRETPQLAAAKKRSYLKRYGREGAAGGWQFLTGQDHEIHTLSRQVGFGYIYDPSTKQYAHPSGLVFLSPEGKVVRYQFGVVFKSSELFSNLQQAATGQPGSTVEKLVFLCFHYNPIKGKYGAAIMLILRVMAALTILALVAVVAITVRKRKGRSVALAPKPLPKGGPAV